VTEENPEVELGEHDWSQMEQLANGVDESEIEPASMRKRVISQDMVRKRVTWDVAPHDEVQAVSDYLGLPAASPEGLEAEHEDAHVRQASVALLMETVEILTAEVARAVVGTMLVMNEGAKEFEVDGEFFTDTVEELEQVIFHSSLSIIAELIDFGLLHTPMLITPEAMGEIMEQVKAEQEEDKGE
jgi:hypothetical protein